MCLVETEARNRHYRATREDCSICLDTLSDTAIVGYRQCSNQHYFHSKCVAKLTSCPLCRTEKWNV